jgi:hypothetical protein
LMIIRMITRVLLVLLITRCQLILAPVDIFFCHAYGNPWHRCSCTILKWSCRAAVDAQRRWRLMKLKFILFKLYGLLYFYFNCLHCMSQTIYMCWIFFQDYLNLQQKNIRIGRKGLWLGRLTKRGNMRCAKPHVVWKNGIKSCWTFTRASSKSYGRPYAHVMADCLFHLIQTEMEEI